MRAYVYTDKSLERYAGRFVWLSVNTEDAKNAAFLAKHKIPALPTLFVIDPKSESVALRYVGGATVPQLRKLLEDAEGTYKAKSLNAADSLLAKGDKLAGEGKNPEALKAYEESLRTAPKGWSRHGRAAESFVLTLALSGDDERCASEALKLVSRLGSTVSGANVASTGLGCLASLEPAKRPKHAEEMAVLEKLTRQALADPKLQISDDDRSGLYMTLIGAREALKDEEGAKKLRLDWIAFLEAAAGAAKTPDQRAVYDSHRLTAYLELGTPEKAIAMLEQSERDLPDDYNAPARLAIAFREMKKYDESLAASERALARIEGPRKLTILTGRADTFAAKGDKEMAKKTIAEAVAYAKSLPEGQRSERRIASLEKRLAGME